MDEQKVKDTGLSPTVKALGVVSMLADISSEMVYPLNAVFITRVLGAPAWALGLIEGIAESTASLLKLYSGWISDRIGKRKPFAVAGYGLGALGKPLIALSGVWWQVLGARFVDRLGKGLRTAPRDALIAENCAENQRGRAFGYHRGMDTTGAVLGPLIGFCLLRYIWVSHPLAHFRSLYWIAFIPGAIGVLVLALMVHEKQREADPAKPIVRVPAPSFAQLSPSYRAYLLIVALFSIGNSSDTFLILRAQSPTMRVPPESVLLLYALFNVVEATLAYSVGRLSDRMDRKRLIALGYGVFALVYLGFATMSGPAAAWGLFVLYGLYYTLTGGTQRALAADLANPDRRATEIGAFHMIVGIAALPASIVAGYLYALHPSAPFYLGAATSGAAALLIATLNLRKRDCD